MRPEHRDLVDEVTAAWNRRDLETILSLAHAEVEYVNAPAALEPGVRSGRDGLSSVFRKQWEGLGATARQAIDEMHPLGDDIVTTGRLSRTMPGSDTRVENKVALRWSFRDDRVVRLELLGAGSSFHDALESLGLGSRRVDSRAAADPGDLRGDERGSDRLGG